MSEASESMLLKVDDEFEEFVAPQPKRVMADSEMDITPMIDIVFLLLIFFLVASTPDQTTAIDLPKAQHGLGVSQLNSVVFSLGEGGIDIAPAYGGDGKVPGTELSDNIEKRAEEVEELTRKGFEDDKADVVIKADANVKVRDVHRIMKAASKVKGIKLHLAVLESETN